MDPCIYLRGADELVVVYVDDIAMGSLAEDGKKVEIFLEISAWKCLIFFSSQETFLLPSALSCLRFLHEGENGLFLEWI